MVGCCGSGNNLVDSDLGLIDVPNSILHGGDD
jgi:hypothetical protein